jgi:hypothetical protein
MGMQAQQRSVSASPYCPVHDPAQGFVGNILLQKVGQNHGVGNAEARSLQEFPHGMFNPFLLI